MEGESESPDTVDVVDNDWATEVLPQEGIREEDVVDIEEELEHGELQDPSYSL